jgi:hypothetical protein
MDGIGAARSHTRPPGSPETPHRGWPIHPARRRDFSASDRSEGVAVISAVGKTREAAQRSERGTEPSPRKRGQPFLTPGARNPRLPLGQEAHGAAVGRPRWRIRRVHGARMPRTDHRVAPRRDGTPRPDPPTGSSTTRAQSRRRWRRNTRTMRCPSIDGGSRPRDRGPPTRAPEPAASAGEDCALKPKRSLLSAPLSASG